MSETAISKPYNRKFNRIMNITTILLVFAFFSALVLTPKTEIAPILKESLPTLEDARPFGGENTPFGAGIQTWANVHHVTWEPCVKVSQTHYQDFIFTCGWTNGGNGCGIILHRNGGATKTIPNPCGTIMLYYWNSRNHTFTWVY